MAGKVQGGDKAATIDAATIMLLSTKRWVDELHSVALINLEGLEIFAVNVTTVYFHYYCGIVLIRAVQKFLHS